MNHGELLETAADRGVQAPRALVSSMLRVVARKVEGADPLRLLHTPDPWSFAMLDRAGRAMTSRGCCWSGPLTARPWPLDGEDALPFPVPWVHSHGFTGAQPGGPWWGLPGTELRLPRLLCVEREGTWLLAIADDKHAAGRLLDEGERLLGVEAPAGPLPALHKRHEATQPYADLVRRALTAIRAGELQKVALATTRQIELSGPLRARPVLDRLREERPGTFRFWAQWGDARAFVGASPERLVRTGPDGLVTEALAGTAARTGSLEGDDLARRRLEESAKDGREHRSVVDAVETTLRRLGLDPQTGAREVRTLPYAYHLWTPIHDKGASPLIDVALALHPTPAVAGAPREPAIERVVQWEAVPRGFYAGFLGWVDRLGHGEAAVGIRSALVDGRRATLFAGAGIVEGSDPERETAEVLHKLQGLEPLLHA